MSDAEEKPRQLGLFTDYRAGEEEETQRSSLEGRVTHVLTLLQRPPLPEGEANLPKRLGYKKNDLNRKYSTEGELRHLLTGLVNLQHRLGKDLALFAAALNPDELFAYAWGIGKRAANPVKRRLDDTSLYACMKRVNEDAYKPGQGIHGKLLQHLQERARKNNREYFPIKRDNLKKRMEILEQEDDTDIASLLTKARAAFLEAKEIGPVHPDVDDERITFLENPRQLDRRALRREINRIIDAAYAAYAHQQY